MSRRELRNYQSQEIDEITAPVRKKQLSKNYYRITAPERGYLNIDLMSLQSEAKFNRGYNYGFVIIDIYSRKGWVYPVKTKSPDETSDVFEKFLKNRNWVQVVQSDSGNEFRGEFEKLLKRKNIEHWTVEIGDHHSMGIVDRFIKTLRGKLLRLWLRRKDLNWVDQIESILTAYNNKHHRGIEAVPNKVFNSKDVPTVKQQPVDLLKVGDSVRLLTDKKVFEKKSSTANWSQKVFVITEIVRGRRYRINNNRPTSYARWQLKRSKFDPTGLSKTDIRNLRNRAIAERRVKTALK